MNASSRFLSSANAKPHHAGAAYVNLAKTTALYTILNASWLMPRRRRILKACIVCAHFPMMSRTCSLTERWFVIVTPSILMVVTRAISGNTAGRSQSWSLRLLLVNIISRDFAHWASSYSRWPAVPRVLVLSLCCEYYMMFKFIVSRSKAWLIILFDLRSDDVAKALHDFISSKFVILYECMTPGRSTFV